MDFLAFSEPSSQNQWENDWADMNFKKIAIWTTLEYILLPIRRFTRDYLGKKLG